MAEQDTPKKPVCPWWLQVRYPTYQDGIRALEEMRERHRQNRLDAERQHEENQHRWYREIDCRRERSR